MLKRMLFLWRKVYQNLHCFYVFQHKFLTKREKIMANLKVLIDEDCKCPPEQLLTPLYLNSPSVVPQDQLGFRWNNNSRQSSNIIDLRGYNYTMVSGSLAWKTSFHLASSTPYLIANCLRKRGFWITSVETRNVNWFKSGYTFTIWMMVLRQYNYSQIKTNVRNALRDVAVASSIDIND